MCHPFFPDPFFHTAPSQHNCSRSNCRRDLGKFSGAPVINCAVAVREDNFRSPRPNLRQKRGDDFHPEMPCRKKAFLRLSELRFSRIGKTRPEFFVQPSQLHEDCLGDSRSELAILVISPISPTNLKNGKQRGRKHRRGRRQ